MCEYITRRGRGRGGGRGEERRESRRESKGVMGREREELEGIRRVKKCTYF